MAWISAGFLVSSSGNVSVRKQHNIPSLTCTRVSLVFVITEELSCALMNAGYHGNQSLATRWTECFIFVYQSRTRTTVIVSPGLFLGGTFDQKWPRNQLIGLSEQTMRQSLTCSFYGWYPWPKVAKEPVDWFIRADHETKSHLLFSWVVPLTKSGQGTSWSVYQSRPWDKVSPALFMGGTLDQKWPRNQLTGLSEQTMRFIRVDHELKPHMAFFVGSTFQPKLVVNEPLDYQRTQASVSTNLVFWGVGDHDPKWSTSQLIGLSKQNMSHCLVHSFQGCIPWLRMVMEPADWLISVEHELMSHLVFFRVADLDPK